jgi:hypothetical protein
MHSPQHDKQRQPPSNHPTSSNTPHTATTPLSSDTTDSPTPYLCLQLTGPKVGAHQGDDGPARGGHCAPVQG